MLLPHSTYTYLNLSPESLSLSKNAAYTSRLCFFVPVPVVSKVLVLWQVSFCMPGAHHVGLILWTKWLHHVLMLHCPVVIEHT